jgi:hypothetical protein
LAALSPRPTWRLCPIYTGHEEFTFEQSFPGGLEGYTVGAVNELAIGVVTDACVIHTCGITFESAWVELTYNSGIDVSVESGNDQFGSTGEPAASPLVVRLRRYEPETVLEGKVVDFKVTSQPMRAKGTALGADGGRLRQRRSRQSPMPMDWRAPRWCWVIKKGTTRWRRSAR